MKRKKRISVTNIGFLAANGREDETQFDTQDERQLAELWWMFCLENKLITFLEQGEIFEEGWA